METPYPANPTLAISILVQHMFEEPRKTYCADFSRTCASRFATAKLCFSAQYLLRSLQFFEGPSGDLECNHP